MDRAPSREPAPERSGRNRPGGSDERKKVLAPEVRVDGDHQMTFSIAAYDPETEKAGVAITSVFPSVGAVCPWVSDDGAVASQSWDSGADYGRPALDMLGHGLSLETTAEALIADRAGGIGTQLHGVTKAGETFAYTGEKCVGWAGHREEAHHTAAGNMLAGADVVDRLSEAYRSTAGPFEERLLSALEAGEAAGGDKRGDNLSAALLVHAPEPKLYHNLRVDEPGSPVDGLRSAYQTALEAETDAGAAELEEHWGGPIPDSVVEYRIRY